jgi:thymidylate synthase
MIAKITDTDAHELIMQLGDAHVYRDHVDALQTQLTRVPRDFPKLKWAREDISDIDDFKTQDFIVEGYKPHPKLEMKMSV